MELCSIKSSANNERGISKGLGKSLKNDCVCLLFISSFFLSLSLSLFLLLRCCVLNPCLVFLQKCVVLMHFKSLFSKHNGISPQKFCGSTEERGSVTESCSALWRSPRHFSLKSHHLFSLFKAGLKWMLWKLISLLGLMTSYNNYFWESITLACLCTYRNEVLHNADSAF